MEHWNMFFYYYYFSFLFIHSFFSFFVIFRYDYALCRLFICFLFFHSFSFLIDTKRCVQRSYMHALIDMEKRKIEFQFREYVIQSRLMSVFVYADLPAQQRQQHWIANEEIERWRFEWYTRCGTWFASRNGRHYYVCFLSNQVWS